MTSKHVLGAIALVLLAAGAAPAEPKVVYLKGGRQFTGEVTRTEGGAYEIKTRIGTVIVSADQVLRIEEAVTPTDELRDRLTKAGKNPEAIYRVALWAREKKMLPEARDLLRQVVQLKPDHENAALMLKLVEMELARKSTSSVRPPTTRDATAPERVKVDPSQLLKTEDIYRIRLLELASNDRVAVELRGDVLDRFIRSMEGRDLFAERGGERRFRKWPRVRQVMYILRNTTDPSIRDDILIKTDPQVMKVFRQRIWPMVRGHCAAPSCHGGPKGAGRMKLFDLPMTDDRVAYTNFYILHNWRDKSRRMIDRAAPSSSLLLQSGLPAKIARPGLAHPGKPLPAVPFASHKHPGYVAIDKWIRSLRVPLLPPGYRVRYRIPGMPVEKPSPATQPAD